MPDRTKLFIDGGFVTAHGDRTFDATNPANGQRTGGVAIADEHDVHSAVEAAAAALARSEWAATTPAERADYLRRIADLLESRGEELARLMCTENGIAIGAQRSSVTKTLAIYRYYADLVEAIPLEEMRPASVGGVTVVRREPLGVGALIVPFNGPQSILSWKLGPALAAGCTVVIKPALETTSDNLLLMEVIEAAGVPAGVVNLVSGDAETGRLLVAHPGINKVAFTGSTSAGVAIAQSCAARLIPVTLELGGKDAAILLDDIDVETFGPLVVGVCSPNAGQVCRACTRVLVHESQYRRGVEVVAAAMSAVRVGDPFEADTQFGPLISAAHRDRVAQFVQIGVAEGATLVTGGKPCHLDTGGYFFEPTVFADVTSQMRIAQEEIFGPVVVVMAYRDDEEAIRIANDTDFGLGGFIHTADVDRGMRMAQRIHSGAIGVNTSAIRLEAPFGGYKHSGLGKELGPEGLAEFQAIKSIYRPEPEYV